MCDVSWSKATFYRNGRKCGAATCSMDEGRILAIRVNRLPFELINFRNPLSAGAIARSTQRESDFAFKPH